MSGEGFGERPLFAYWAKMSYWTLDEAVALAFGKDPEAARWKSIEHDADVPFAREYRRVRKLAKRAKDLWQSGERVQPGSFLAWAKCNEIEVPPELVREVESQGVLIADWKDLYDKLKMQFDECVAASEKLTEEAKELRGRIAELEQSAWEGFDPDSETYPPELDIALQTWRAVTNQRDPSKAAKEQIREWLDAHYPKLSKEAKQRIAVVCNWEKAGGKRGGAIKT